MPPVVPGAASKSRGSRTPAGMTDVPAMMGSAVKTPRRPSWSFATRAATEAPAGITLGPSFVASPKT